MILAKILISLAAIALACGDVYAASAEQDKSEGMVVFYSSMTAEHHNALVKAFNKKNPQIKLEGFRSNSISVLNRVLNEGRAGHHLVDVINVNELNAWVLKDRGLLQPHKSKETEVFPKEFRDAEGLLLCCADVLTSDMAYNIKLVRKEEAPKSYQDLLLPIWKGKIGMEYDMAELFAALIPIWGKDRTVNYFRALKKQEPSRRRGRSLLGQLLAAGEFPGGSGFLRISRAGDAGNRRAFGNHSGRTGNRLAETSAARQKRAPSQCGENIHRLCSLRGRPAAHGEHGEDRGQAGN